MREGDEKKMTDKDDEFLKMGFGKRKERFDLDLNLPFEESFFGLGFQNSASEEAGFECFDRLVAYGDDNGRGSSSGGGVELSKRRRFSTEEKAKGKIDDDGTVNNNRNLDLNLSLGLFGRDPVEESFEILNLVDKLSSNSAGPSVENELQRNELDDDAPVHAVESTQHAVARSFAEKFAQPEKHREQQGTKRILSCEDDKEVKDSQSPFALAMEVIENRNASQKVLRKSSSGLSESLFKWVPAERTECSGSYHRSAPTLMDLSLNVLARNAHKIVSLENVPDELRHKLSKMVSNCRNMDAHFVELLTRDSPTEIRVWDTSQLTEDECSKILYACDTRNLTVLQYDLCGLCMPEYVLRRILAGPLCRLHKLAILSLKGAHRLSDAGLSALAKSAPALLSINLSQCSLLTSDGINHLASHLEHNLRELYLDDCQSINVMLILPALKKFKHLEVLSVAGIQTVRDDFVIEMVEACGMSMKELVLANCLDLTDRSLKHVGRNCPKLCALDLSHLRNLTDSTLQYLANSCRTICKLILCRNDFSDDAIAAFLEASGHSLNVLSLNNICMVDRNTALSIAKCLRNLWSLDLSWCRKLTNEALGLIVDSCSSLKVLKLFGCSQVTDVFLKGHSNSQVHIIGCKMTPCLDHLDPLDLQKTPLKYSLIC